MNIFFSKQKYHIGILMVMVLFSIVFVGVNVIKTKQADTTALDEAQTKDMEVNIEDPAFSPEQARVCWDYLEKEIVGKWEYIGGELTQIPYITFRSDQTFVTNAWGGTEESVSGRWKFDQGYLVLDFADDNEYWENKTEESMHLYAESDITFESEKNILIVPIQYTQREEEFNGECTLAYFYIDMMNYFLFKRDERVN